MVEASHVLRQRAPRLSLPARLAAVLAVLLSVLIAPAVAGAATYYVSPAGSDGHSGRSPASAWRTIFRVNKAKLRPGDTVLFQAGATFSDDTLMPGWGLSVSGTRRAPVTFGSYGGGDATLSKGIWIKGERHLLFENFNLGPYEGVSGTGSYDAIVHCVMRDFMGQVEIPVDVIGWHWLIAGNTIDHTGDSGMLVRGGKFIIAGNTITNTGLNPAITYGSHGIYLKAPDSKAIGNVILNFRDDGVSVRYRNSVVSQNTIAGGKFGIAYFQGDRRTGHTRFTDNVISATTIAGIYVSPYGIGGTTHENMRIAGNRISRPAGLRAHAGSAWEAIALSHNQRRYHIHGNSVH